MDIKIIRDMVIPDRRSQDFADGGAKSVESALAHKKFNVSRPFSVYAHAYWSF